MVTQLFHIWKPRFEKKVENRRKCPYSKGLVKVAPPNVRETRSKKKLELVWFEGHSLEQAQPALFYKA